MSAIFLQGDARVVLQGLPDNFFHCAVTSPPYFGLRKYDGGEEIWDGDSDCEHEWGKRKVTRRGHPGTKSTLVGTQTAELSKAVDTHGSTCLLCGAWKGQLGGEPTPDLYISHLIQIMREVRRVLRPDGVFFINIGDSWAGGKGQSGQQSPEYQAARQDVSLNKPYHQIAGQKQTRALDDRRALRGSGIKPLDMVLIPSMLALAARADGWYVRSMVCWDKKNSMPESVNGWRWEKHKVKAGDKGRGKEAWRVGANDTPQQDHAPDGSFKASAVWQDCPGCPKCSSSDGYILRKGSWRPTDSYEFVLMLTKTNSYFCDKTAVLEQGVYPAGESRQGGDGHKSLSSGSRTTEGLHNKEWVGNGGRNLRSVWSFPTKPGKFNHHAAYPPHLPETCIKASTSESGCCPKCGAPWARVIGRIDRFHDQWGPAATKNAQEGVGSAQSFIRDGQPGCTSVISESIGWRPTCSCDAGNPVSCRVLDPFSGAGTTAMVAEQLGVDSVSIDTSAEYIQISKDRLAFEERKRIDELIKQAKRTARDGKK